MNKHPSEFYRWLKRQADRDDPIGDLASDVMQDKEAPTIPGNQTAWLKHLELRRAHRDAITAFKEAWKEYKSAR